MPDEAPRSRAARAAAEEALIRVIHHYGDRPDFVLLGGLVPDLLCSTSDLRHAGTTDVDIQVDLEIALGSTSARRLERALLNAEFTPDDRGVWRRPHHPQQSTGHHALPGIKDPATLEHASRLVGDTDVARPSTTIDAHGQRSTTEGIEHRRLAPDHALRTLPDGHAVVIYGSLPPIRVELRPWYRYERLSARTAASTTPLQGL